MWYLLLLIVACGNQGPEGFIATPPAVPEEPGLIEQPTSEPERTPTESLSNTVLVRSVEDVRGLTYFVVHLDAGGRFSAVRREFRTIEPVYGSRRFNFEQTVNFSGEWYVDDLNPVGVELRFGIEREFLDL